MKNTPHTPTPLRWEPKGNFILDANGNVVADIPCCAGNPADGPFIVLSFNLNDLLVAALKFYADKRSYEGPNHLAKKGEESQGPYRLDVVRDGGAKARAALAAVKKEKPRIETGFINFGLTAHP